MHARGRRVLGVIGLEQHEVGALAVSQLLPRPGFGVIYLGRFQTPQRMVAAAVAEDAEIVGVSCHSWEFTSFVPELVALARQSGPGVVVRGSLTPEQRERYSRHLLIPEVGSEGQATLLESKVLLVGAGGLGSPAGLYLAAAGVGTIGIVDFDVVDVSNLQRQILHTTDRVGERKVESARKSIQALNPEVEVVGHEEMLTTENVDRIIEGYDVILDGTDTFETRYALNDAAVAAGIPVVHASVFRFEGQLTVFKPYEGPCYRCLYPTPPPPELAPGCSVAGVLGVVPGIMGMLQANEVLKLLLGIGDSLAGRLLLFDALDVSFTELKLKRDPACPVCSEAAIEARKAGRPLEVATVGADAPFALGGSFGSIEDQA